MSGTNGLELAGKAALVTGGSRGIGAAIARALAEKGADVAFTYLNSANRAGEVRAAIEALGRRALPIHADSADPAAISGAVAEAHRAFGRLDVLVNNAGIAQYGAFEDVSVEEIDRMLAVHVRAAFVAAQAASRVMGEGGRIVSIGSNLVARSALPGLALYTTSKAALVGMTQSLARELGPRGITVNLVNPGSTDTDMNPAGGPAAAAQVQLNALGRFAEPEDIGRMVAYLAGEGGRNITGSSLLVDGGTNA